MFVGTFEHSLDEKGRLVLPAAFRPDLADGGVLAPWDGCLALWPPSRFAEVAREIKTRVSEGDMEMNLMRVFFAAAHTVRPDKQGRFVVPDEQRSRAALGRDLTVVGQVDRVEIWSRDRFGTIRDDMTDELGGLVRQLRLP